VSLDHPEQLRQTFQKAAQAAMLSVRIESATIEKTGPGFLAGHVSVDASSAKHNGDIYIAVAIERTVTDVKAGENQGKKLTNVSVVKSLTRVGKLEKGKDLSVRFRVKLWEGMSPDNLRVVAFVQEPDGGIILGATMVKGVRQE
jgi:hypothetical protein